MSRPTLRDVAAKAGLSVTQVSRALNDHDDVAEATKRRAREVAAELRYTPNLDARRLKDPGVRADTIGMILPSDSLRFSDPFFGDLLTALVSEAATHGLQLTMSAPPPDASAIEPYDLAIRRKQVDGFVIVRTGTSDPRIDFLLDADFPFVAFGRPWGRAGFPVVDVAADCFDPAVDHLIELGHTRIGCVAEPSRFAIGTARALAFLRAADDRGVTIDPMLVVEAGFHEGSGFEAAAAMLARPEPPTAIVTMNDLLALGVLEAASSAGLSVPDDLTVVGFDDIPAAGQVRPALTTLRQSAVEVGAMLIRELLPAIESGGNSDSEQRVRAELVVRESSGPPRRP